MKHLLTTFTALLFFASLQACGNDDDGASGDNDNSTANGSFTITMEGTTYSSENYDPTGGYTPMDQMLVFNLESGVYRFTFYVNLPPGNTGEYAFNRGEEADERKIEIKVTRINGGESAFHTIDGSGTMTITQHDNGKFSATFSGTLYKLLYQDETKSISGTVTNMPYVQD